MEAQLRERTAKRQERSVSRRTEAEKYKAAGNDLFRAGEYRKAISEYNYAIIKHGPRSVYLSNTSAAWLKLGEFDAAERSASAALSYDPKFIKARYRRGLARKGNLQLAAAAIDFRAVLEMDSASIEAKSALEETLTLMRARNEEDTPRPTPGVRTGATSTIEGDGITLESLSDSSDCQHAGNGKPCRDYNHDGCMRGAQCEFSHAPDYRSVRDGLGRNVCLDFLLILCPVAVDENCVYAHETTYLRSDGWWNNASSQFLYRSMILRADEDKPPELALYRLMNTDGVLWNSPGMVQVCEEVTGMKRASDGTPAYTLRVGGGFSDTSRSDKLTHDEIQARAQYLKKFGEPMVGAAMDLLRVSLPTS
ncbi:hypothetical protein BC834DRAFT_970456 [Gloeopeniophorella convolvens]|nr:hypothetical protein BC834DRAFT_970456 [Gloeopeniophorella convolvens]